MEKYSSGMMKKPKKNNFFIQKVCKDYNLLLELSLNDVKKRFSGTYFGIVWSFFQPLMTILVYWLVFQYGFKSGPVGGVPYITWFIPGIISWLFVSEAITNASNSFLEYDYLIKKVKFDINILPMVKILSSFCVHIFFCFFAIIICAFMGYAPGVKLLQIVYYFIATICFLFAISLITSPIMVFFRDLGQIINIILLLGMWGTPIVWDINTFPESMQRILRLNPFYYLVEGYRDSMLSRGWFWEKASLGIYFWVITGVAFFLGRYIFAKLKPYFADTI